MARTVERLTDLKVRKLTEPGRYPDGAGLLLQIATAGTKSWIYRFMLNGKSREMGLGPFPLISLSEARAAATDARKLCFNGIDPIEERRAARAKTALEKARSVTFGDAAKRYIAAHRAAWRNEKHATQWEATLATYVEPHIDKLPVQDIETGLVMKVLEPIWSEKPETAARVRGRVEAIINWATARGYRIGDNPARWRGHLEKLLPKRSKVRKVRHHPCLSYGELPNFMSVLRKTPGTAARALEFAILTAARTGEVIGAQVSEIDLENKVWIVPADRMKAGNEHRVPLCERAIDIVKEISRDEKNAHVFPGRYSPEGLSNMSLLKVLKTIGRSDVTVHGFRSSFRDWAAEQTNHPAEVVEMALAHTVQDKTEAAYRRGDLFEKRAQVMSDWGAHCSPDNSGKVLSFGRKHSAA